MSTPPAKSQFDKSDAVGVQLRRTRRGLAVCLLFRARLRTQPQRDVGWLHRLPYHPYQGVAQGGEICFVAQLDREGFQGLPGIVLPTVEAPVYKALDATSQGVEQGGDHEGGRHYSELGLLLLAGERAEDHLARRHAPEIHHPEQGGERTVDEGAVDDVIYL